MVSDGSRSATAHPIGPSAGDRDPWGENWGGFRKVGSCVLFGVLPFVVEIGEDPAGRRADAEKGVGVAASAVASTGLLAVSPWEESSIAPAYREDGAGGADAAERADLDDRPPCTEPFPRGSSPAGSSSEMKGWARSSGHPSRFLGSFSSTPCSKSLKLFDMADGYEGDSFTICLMSL